MCMIGLTYRGFHRKMKITPDKIDIESPYYIQSAKKSVLLDIVKIYKICLDSFRNVTFSNECLRILNVYLSKLILGI